MSRRDLMNVEDVLDVSTDYQECPSCRGYGYFDEDGEPTTDRRGRKCLDCGGEGTVTK
jgi:DnaJ-class molecular chaperone